MSSPLISVIVPIYNMESLLPRCLDSLAAQTLRDLEIICVDDGSTDGSGGIVRKYASGDSRFRLITQENSGRAEARNAGIRAAAAPYLGFADPDDYVEPDMYERCYRLAEETGADMVQCSYSPFLPAESEESRGMAEEKLLHIENTACDGVFTEKGEIFRLFLEDRITGVVWSKLFRRLLPGCSAPLEVRLPSSFTSGEDTLYVSRANGRLMEKPPEGGGPMESAEDMLCRLFAFLRKQTRRLILLSSPPSDYGSARHPYAEEPGVLEAWNALLRTLAGKLNLPFIDFCGDMLQYRPLPGSGEEDFPEAYRNLGKQILHRLPFGQTWVRRRSGKIHRLLEKRRKRRKERMLARWRTLAAPPHYREETDWITAIHSEKGQARILLIGDSVMRHLWRPLASELQEDIDLFSSTLIPGDPDYLPTLAGYFPSAGYEAVIVSFGSYVTNKVSAISVDDFRKNYMAFVSQLSKRCRFLILATSTSIMDGPDGTLNEEKEKTLAAFNAIVREAASSLPGAVLSDHHGFMQGRRYIDPFHFSPPDRAYQAGKTAGLLLPLLSARQEPPKEQECPKTRPEP